MDAMLKVERQTPDYDAITTAKAAVLEILNAQADQKTIRLALTVFKESVSAGPVTIANNVLTANCCEDSDGISIG